jgi:hypothetical protein
VIDSAGQDTGCILRVRFAVDLERFLESIGGVIGLVEVLGLNGSCFLEGLTSFLICCARETASLVTRYMTVNASERATGVATWGNLTHLLYSKGISSLGVQIGGIFVFLGPSTKPTEAA